MQRISDAIETVTASLERYALVAGISLVKAPIAQTDNMGTRCGATITAEPTHHGMDIQKSAHVSLESIQQRQMRMHSLLELGQIGRRYRFATCSNLYIFIYTLQRIADL